MLAQNALYGILLALVGQVAAAPRNSPRHPPSSHAPSPSSPPQSGSVSDQCHVTRYADISAAVRACTMIVLDSLVVPARGTIDLSNLKPGSKVVFRGRTTWQYADANWAFIKISGQNIEVTADPGAVLDGNGQMWWDGVGSNGGRTKPNHFIEINKLTRSSVHDLYIQNWPVHCFMITESSNLDVHHITLNNTAGYAPNDRSKGLPAAHNTDGFGIARSSDMTVRDSVVINQDDCVAVTSGNNILVTGMHCTGSHGLSVGSVGGKANNVVTNVQFTNSVVSRSDNGVRIKSNAGTTGLISNILFENIVIENAAAYGIDIQQDYLNGGPTGKPTNGVKISNVTMRNIRGTVTRVARNYYILCGKGSCSNLRFENVHIQGSHKVSVCNFRTSGDFDCDGRFAA